MGMLNYYSKASANAEAFLLERWIKKEGLSS